ncbi:MAG: hypothetical protein LBM77_00380 [Spirochaetaceae bacterium]|jgi:hypothetical protein|nr:hypothetical protein [Spirochaetaceae bacterium]
MFEKKFKGLLLATCYLLLATSLSAEPHISETYGFSIDLPEGYQLEAGNGKDSFSFASPWNTNFTLRIYPTARYADTKALAEGMTKQIASTGDMSDFTYRGEKSYLMELDFSLQGAHYSGWALALKLPSQKGMLAALAYGPATSGAEARALDNLHLSCIDSVRPSLSANPVPGPVSAFSHPKGERQSAAIKLSPDKTIQSFIHKDDADAAQELVEREYQVLTRYQNRPELEAAWKRYYRRIFEDSFSRLDEVSFDIERALGYQDRRDFAGQVLAWTQSFTYERNFDSSDFVNPVTAAIEGRGDCDSRAVLWAIVLEHNNIKAGIMVSPEYKHAMGIADIPKSIGKAATSSDGARFTVDGKAYLVAETTDNVAIGQIAQSVSRKDKWFGVVF